MSKKDYEVDIMEMMARASHTFPLDLLIEKLGTTIVDYVEATDPVDKASKLENLFIAATIVSMAKGTKGMTKEQLEVSLQRTNDAVDLIEALHGKERNDG